MSKILIKDGIKYYPWTPQDELREFEPMIIHHVKDIFGPGTEYFPKAKLKTLANNRRIPDGFVVDYDKKKWYVVELKLLCPDAINRIVGQIVDYKNAVNNPATRRNIYKHIREIKPASFLDDLINEKNPIIVVIINSLDGEPGAQFKERVIGTDSSVRLTEFKTYARDNVEKDKVHIHLYEPLYKTKISPPPTPPEEGKGTTKKGKEYDETENLKRGNDKVREMYWILDKKIHSLDENIWKKIGDHYTDYRYKETIASVNIRKDGFKIFLKVGGTKLHDPRKMCTDVPKSMRYGNLTKTFIITSEKDFPYAMQLIKQALIFVKKKRKMGG